MIKASSRATDSLIRWQRAKHSGVISGYAQATNTVPPFNVRNALCSHYRVAYAAYVEAASKAFGEYGGLADHGKEACHSKNSKTDRRAGNPAAYRSTARTFI
jgi:hypothetical protein